jgi:prepilin-type N-terminal cleavage/methylation domain-containing protein
MPNRATSRRDPLNGKNGFSTIKGFTVIELMIGIAVLAILTSLAFPSFRAIQEKRQVTKGAEQIAAFLSQAKGEAVRLNDDVALSYSISGADWCIGYSNGQDACVCGDATDANYCVIEHDYDRDDTVDAVEPRVFGAGSFSDPTALSAITFKNSGGTALGSSSVMIYDAVRGMLQVDDATTQAARASLALVSTPTGKYALNVEVDRLGGISLCSPSASGHLQVPGYDTCTP